MEADPFDWDESNRAHIGRHGVTAQEFEQAMANAPVEIAEYTVAGEPRVHVVGITDAGRLFRDGVRDSLWADPARYGIPAETEKRRFYYAKFPKRSH